MKRRKRKRISDLKSMRHFAYWTFGIVLFMSLMHLCLLYTKIYMVSQRMPPYHYYKKSISGHNYNMTFSTNITSGDSDTREANDYVFSNQSHVMLFGYMRGGTTFMGEILGLRPGTFYVYEPLLGTTLFDYFKGRQLCNVWTGKCREDKRSLLFGAKQYITNIHNCHLEGMASIDVLNKVAMGQRLDNWTLLDKCDKLDVSNCPNNKNRSPVLSENYYCRKSQLSCLKQEQNLCEISNIVFTKTLRLSLNDTEEFFAKNPSFKLIHLVRDPRAIIHSRFKVWSKYCSENISLCSRGLCDKMANDYYASVYLKTLYPKRIYTLYYEKFVNNPLQKLKEMFKFLGINVTSFDEDQLLSRIKANTSVRFNTNVWSTILAENSVVTSRKWRRAIKPSHLEAINQACVPVFKLYGYRTIQLKDELQNMRVSTLY